MESFCQIYTNGIAHQTNLLHLRILGKVVEQGAEADGGRLEARREEERSLQQ